MFLYKISCKDCVILFFGFFLVCFPNITKCQTYLVTSPQLNVRSEPNAQSSIIERLDQNDKVTSLGEKKGWIKVNVRGTVGYINIKYLKELGEPQNHSTEPQGFKDGFIHVFKYAFLTIFTLLGMRDYARFKRIKDTRYKKGFREIPFTQIELFKYAVYACIFSLPVGFIGGIIYWLNS